MSGAADGCPGEGIRPPLSLTGTKETAPCSQPRRSLPTRPRSSPTSSAAASPTRATSSSASSRCSTATSGPSSAEAPKGSPRRKSRRVLASLKEVKEMRPGRNEIIVCTGLNVRSCGVQYWDCLATGLFHDRRQKG